jgi:hypothetical protein
MKSDKKVLKSVYDNKSYDFLELKNLTKLFVVNDIGKKLLIINIRLRIFLNFINNKGKFLF